MAPFGPGATSVPISVLASSVKRRTSGTTSRTPVAYYGPEENGPGVHGRGAQSRAFPLLPFGSHASDSERESSRMVDEVGEKLADVGDYRWECDRNLGISTIPLALRRVMSHAAFVEADEPTLGRREARRGESSGRQIEILGGGAGRRDTDSIRLNPSGGGRSAGDAADAAGFQPPLPDEGGGWAGERRIALR